MSFNVVNCGKASEYVWTIENFSLSEGIYRKPNFLFEEDSWYMRIFPNGADGYINLQLIRQNYGSPIEVEFSVALKRTKGGKGFERREIKCFEKGMYYYNINGWIHRSEFINRLREFLSSGGLTIILTMKKADSGEFETVSAAAACSCCKGSLKGDKISFHQKCLERNLVKCPRCDQLVSLQKWFDHKCQIENITAKSLREDGNSFHKDCLNKTIKRPRFDNILSFENWRYNAYQMANAKASSNSAESSVICDHYKILQDLKQLLLNQEQTDVVLRVKGKEFAVHKAILTARSPVFASTFRHKMKENKTGIVDIEDCDPSVIPDFLRFLYCNDTSNLSGENVFILFTIADKYQCEDLRVKCVRFIEDNLTVKTFCKALALALLHSEANLLRLTTDFFIKNANKILVTVDWQTFVAENPTYSNELFIKYVNLKTHSNCLYNQPK